MLIALCSLGKENKTRTAGFDNRTDMLQRQQNIAQEQQVLQKSAEYERIKILKHRFNIYQSTNKCICNRVATRS